MKKSTKILISLGISTIIIAIGLLFFYFLSKYTVETIITGTIIAITILIATFIYDFINKKY